MTRYERMGKGCREVVGAQVQKVQGERKDRKDTTGSTGGNWLRRSDSAAVKTVRYEAVGNMRRVATSYSSSASLRWPLRQLQEASVSASRSPRD